MIFPPPHPPAPSSSSLDIFPTYRQLRIRRKVIRSEHYGRDCFATHVQGGNLRFQYRLLDRGTAWRNRRTSAVNRWWGNEKNEYERNMKRRGRRPGRRRGEKRPSKWNNYERMHLVEEDRFSRGLLNSVHGSWTKDTPHPPLWSVVWEASTDRTGCLRLEKPFLLCVCSLVIGISHDQGGGSGEGWKANYSWQWNWNFRFKCSPVKHVLPCIQYCPPNKNLGIEISQIQDIWSLLSSGVLYANSTFQAPEEIVFLFEGQY